MKIMKKLSLFTVLTLVVMATTVTTFSYFTDKAVSEITVSSGEYNLRIDSNDDTSLKTPLSPGMTKNYSITYKNTGNLEGTLELDVSAKTPVGTEFTNEVNIVHNGSIVVSKPNTIGKISIPNVKPNQVLKVDFQLKLATTGPDTHQGYQNLEIKTSGKLKSTKSTWQSATVQILSTTTYGGYINKYPVAFDSVGGTSIPTQSIDYGKKVIPPINPTKAGHTFTGWSPAITTTITGPTTFTATWTINKYNVKFDTVGGTTIPDQTITYNQKVTPPTAPTKVGHTFKGWSPGIDTLVKDNMTFTAIWQINVYTVSFNSKGGSLVPSQQVNYGAKATSPITTRKGYIFKGWTPNPTVTIIKGNTEFSAVWEATKQTLTVDPSGGLFRGSTSVKSVIGNYDTQSILRAPIREGHTFTGWTKTGTGTVSGFGAAYYDRDYSKLSQDDYWMDNIIVYNNDPNGNVKHTKPTLAINPWSGVANSKILRINTTGVASPGHGGYYQSTTSAPSSEYYHVVVAKIPVGSMISQANNAVGTGSKFTWLTPRDGTGEVETYIYKLDTGPTGDFRTFSHVFLAGNTAPIEWDVYYSEVFDATNGKTDALSRAFTFDNESSTTIKANWTINKHTVKFNSAGGTAVPDQVVNYGSKIVMPPTPTRTGYTFVNWGPGSLDAITGDTTLTAQWNINKYSVTFDSSGGSAVSPQTINHGSKVVVPTSPTRVGYTFTGWTPTLDTVITGARTFTATWSLNSYAVTFNSVGGTAVTGQTISHGSKVVIPTVPTKVGYTFKEWSPAIGTAITGPTTFTAVWTLNTYTVTFNSVGGTAIPTQVVSHGTKVTAPADPTKVGYTFAGWSPAIGTAITGTTTFTASWTLNSYTVTFNSTGGTVIPNQTINHGSKVVVPTVPTKVGYTFKEWSPAITSVITGNTTFAAVWTLNSYTVIFNTAGGNTIPNQTINHGQKVVVPTNPTRAGHTFTGWSAGMADAITGNKTFTASWTINSYTVTFNTAGGNAIPAQTINYGSKVVAPANPTRTGYTFVSWDKAITTTITGATTFTASWKINTYSVTFNTAGGSTAPATQTINHGSTVVVPPNPTKTGHTFKAWSPAIGTAITGTTTFTATWTPIKYTVTFNTAGGSTAPVNQSIDYGSKVVVPPNPTKTGHTFAGWSPAIGTVITGARTFTATWTPIKYAVTFNTAGGSTAPATQQVAYNTAAAVPANPTKAGYKFTGWSPAIGTLITGPRTFTATWIEYTLFNYSVVSGGYSVNGFNTTYIAEQLGNVQPKSIAIPNTYLGKTVVAVGANAFDTKGLTAVTLPTGLKTAGNRAFANNAITAVTIPNMSAIGEYMFYLNSLKTVTVPATATRVGRAAFAANQLTSVSLPNSATPLVIGNSSFFRNKLTTVGIPARTTVIEQFAFKENLLTSAIIPNKVTSIGEEAFRINRITSITIPNSVTTMGTYVFEDNVGGTFRFNAVRSGDRTSTPIIIAGRQQPASFTYQALGAYRMLADNFGLETSGKQSAPGLEEFLETEVDLPVVKSLEPHNWPELDDFTPPETGHDLSNSFHPRTEAIMEVETTE